MRGALIHSRAKGSTRLVLTILATFADNHRCAWPAVATIAELANVSERRVQTALADLVKLREIEIITPGGGRNRTTKYRLTLQTCSPLQLAEWVKSLKGVSRVLRPGAFTGQRVNTSSPEGVGGHGAARAVVGLSLYSEEEREVIELYHSKLVALRRGWLGVTMFTQALREAIAMLPKEDWQELFSECANAPDTWPERKTLVRLAWHNY